PGVAGCGRHRSDDRGSGGYDRHRAVVSTPRRARSVAGCSISWRRSRSDRIGHVPRRPSESKESGPGPPPDDGKHQGRHSDDEGAPAMNEHEGYTGGMPGSGDPQPKSDRTPDEIEREIEQTRGRMGRDIDELGQRLSPQNIKEQAKE